MKHSSMLDIGSREWQMARCNERQAARKAGAAGEPCSFGLLKTDADRDYIGKRCSLSAIECCGPQEYALTKATATAAATAPAATPPKM